MTLHIHSRSYRTSSITDLIDLIHTRFDRPQDHPPSTLESASLSKLLVHEWVANLVQHADFGDRSPEIRIHVERDGCRNRYIIEDNSEGFDLEASMAHPLEAVQLPERGMGLLILDACSDELVYRSLGPRQNRLEIVVSDEPSMVDVGLPEAA